MSLYKKVMHFKKWSGFFGPPCIFELYVPDFLYDEKFWKLDHDFRYFLANFQMRMRRNGQKTTFVEIFNFKFEIPMGCFVSYSNTNFGGASAKIYTCFVRKTAFVMQNVRNLRDIGGGGDNFLTKPPKGTSLPDFTLFEP